MKDDKFGYIYMSFGIFVLIVSIIGSTFAYFSAKASDNNNIKGSTAKLDLKVEVTDLTISANTGIIPINEVDLSSALNGYQSKGRCIDKNDRTACKLYEVKVINTGDSNLTLSGTLSLTASGYSNMKWINFNSVEGSTSKIIPNSVPIGSTNNISQKVIVVDDILTVNSSKYYYIMIYVKNNDNLNQANTDKGPFTGVVTFDTGSGGVSAKFNS